jgi:hypothetical protein
MLSTRGIWHKGWKASTEHGPPIDIGKFDKDRWQLFNTDEGRSEARDLAEKYPERVRELAELWLAEAKKNNVLPLNDLGIQGIHALEYKVAPPVNGRYTYYPGTTEIPEASAARTLGVSYKVLAEVEFSRQSQGVIFAQGSRFGGQSLFVKNGKIHYVYNFLGIPPEQRVSCDAPASGKHVVGIELVKEGLGEYHEARGQMKLYLDDKLADSGPFRTMTGHYAICGEGLCIGTDSGDPVSSAYTTKFPFTSGRVVKVVFDVGNDVYEDVEPKFAALMARD